MEFFNEVEYVHDNEDESDPESRHGDKVGPLQHTRWPPVVRRAHSADENYQVQELKKNTDLQLTWSFQMYVGKVSLGFYFVVLFSKARLLHYGWFWKDQNSLNLSLFKGGRFGLLFFVCRIRCAQMCPKLHSGFKTIVMQHLPCFCRFLEPIVYVCS